MELALKDFFVYSKIHVKKWKEIIVAMIQNARYLISLTEEYQIIDRKLEICIKNFNYRPDISREVGSGKLVGMEQEAVSLREKQQILAEMNNTMLQKADAIERLAHKEDLSQSTSKGSYFPPLLHLVEYTEDLTRIYNVSFLQIDTALSNMNYKDIFSIRDLHTTLISSKEINPHTEEILALAEHFITDIKPQ